MISKRVSPKGRSVRVTFAVPAQLAKRSICIAGSFNDWDTESHPLRLDEKRGVWQRAISFKPGTEVQFRYFVDGHAWHNEAEADAWVPTPFFSDNSVLAL